MGSDKWRWVSVDVRGDVRGSACGRGPEKSLKVMAEISDVRFRGKRAAHIKL